MSRDWKSRLWLGLFVSIGLLVCLGVANSGVWATSEMQPGYQTVPTMPPTGAPSPTQPPTEVPIATKPPTVSPQSTPSATNAPLPTSQPTGSILPTQSPPAPLPLPTAAMSPSPSSADLRLQFGANTPYALAGQEIRYSIIVRNAGPGPSGSLVVRDILPTPLYDARGWTSAGELSQSGNSLVVRLDALPAGASLELRIDVRILPDTPAGTLIENRVQVDHAESTWESEPIIVALPPAELPRVGGA
jgi:uncharacterized repeat protein (TIGR01451 family)